MSMHRPTITPKRIVQISRETESWRRLYFDDNHDEAKNGILNAAKCWEWFASYLPETVKIRFDHNLDRTEKRVAFVLKLDPYIRLISSKLKFEKAKKGARFQNFVLAHEIAHIILGHSENSTSAKPFSLHSENGVLKALAEDVDEVEAHYGAILLQIGDQIFEKDFDVTATLKIAATDEVTLRRLAKICQLDTVQRLWKESQKIPRVVL